MSWMILRSERPSVASHASRAVVGPCPSDQVRSGMADGNRTCDPLLANNVVASSRVIGSGQVPSREAGVFGHRWSGAVVTGRPLRPRPDLLMTLTPVKYEQALRGPNWLQKTAVHPSGSTEVHGD